MIRTKHNSTEFENLCRVEMRSAMVRIAICDDNRFFLDNLRVSIRKYLDCHNISAEIHIYERAEAIPESLLASCDLFFLDIDLENDHYNGIDIAQKIRQFRKDSVIIFVTNYIEYAPEGYEVQAFRYLLKSEIKEKLERFLTQALAKLQVEQQSLDITIAGEPYRVLLSEILYIESQAHIAVIYAQKKGNQAVKEYRFYSSLTKLEDQLSPQGFLRIQKSYLVNMRHLAKLQCKEAVLDNGMVLPVSEKHYSAQKKQYMLWKGRL